MNSILYIHGLESKLSSEKRSVLERYGKVYAPDLDYYTNPDSIVWLYEQFKNSKIDVIIGSSMGGFAGYHLAKLLQVRALLFNPALARRSVAQQIPITPETNGADLRFILGAQDDVVNPQETFTYLGEVLSHPQNYSIHMRHDLEHRIPYEVFEEEVNAFFKHSAVNSPKPKRLFLDDIRSVDMVFEQTFESEFDIVRSYDDFVTYIKLHGLPDFISFDNDLGHDRDGQLAPDGLAAAKWLVYESGLDLRNLQFKVHSANPVATQQIQGLLNNYIKFLKNS